MHAAHSGQGSPHTDAAFPGGTHWFCPQESDSHEVSSPTEQSYPDTAEMMKRDFWGQIIKDITTCNLLSLWSSTAGKPAVLPGGHSSNPVEKSMRPPPNTQHELTRCASETPWRWLIQPSLAFGRPQRLRLTLDCNLLGPAQDHTAKHSQVPNRWNLREVTHTLTGEAADSWPHRSDNWSTWASCGCLRMNSKLFPQGRFAGSLDSWRLPNVPS